MTDMTMRQARREALDDAEPPGRRERNKRDKLARIVAAARTLFHKQGFAETTTQEIAHLADIGSGTLFLYAKSKEDLLILVFKDEILKVVDRASANCPKSASVLDQLLHVFNACVAYHKQDLALATALIKEITLVTNAERRSDINELMDGIYAKLRVIIERGQTAGVLRRDVDSDIAARNAFASYYMTLIGWLGGFTGHAAFQAQLRPMLQLQLDGIATRTLGRERAAAR
jgi:AcrR family transcriptional regulator